MKTITVYLWQDENDRAQLFVPPGNELPIYLQAVGEDCVMVEGYVDGLQYYTGPYMTISPNPKPVVDGKWMWSNDAIYITGRRLGVDFIIKVAQWGDTPVLSVPEYMKATAVNGTRVQDEEIEFFAKYPTLQKFYLNPNIGVYLLHNSKTIRYDCMGIEKGLYQSVSVKGVKLSAPMDKKEELRNDILALSNGKKVEKLFGLSGDENFISGSEVWNLEMVDGKALVVEWSEPLPADIEEYHGCEVVRENRSYVSVSMACKNS